MQLSDQSAAVSGYSYSCSLAELHCLLKGIEALCEKSLCCTMVLDQVVEVMILGGFETSCLANMHVSR